MLLAAVAGGASGLSGGTPEEPVVGLSRRSFGPSTRNDDGGIKDLLAGREWLSPLRRCHQRGSRTFCDGPRRVPRPTGAAAELTARFGLDSKLAYYQLMDRPAPAELLAAVQGEASELLLWPVPDGFYGRGFGYVRRAELADRIHKGIDIPAKTGAQVLAANDGMVIYADNEATGYGNLLIILHPDDTRTVYAHLSRSWVSTGEMVRRGQHVGDVGMTGMARAPHVHFEFRVRGAPRNPARRFENRPGREDAQRIAASASRRLDAIRERRASTRTAERSRRVVRSHSPLVARR